jgi:hypothetical protein
MAMVLRIRIVPPVMAGGAAAQTYVSPGQARETEERSQLQERLNSFVAMELSAPRGIFAVKNEANSGGGFTIVPARRTTARNE